MISSNKCLVNYLYTFGYAGPIIATIAFNSLGALIATICVYIYLNRKKFKKNKILTFITKPFHGIISKIATKNLEKKNRKIK